MIKEIKKRIKLLITKPKILREDYLHPLTMDEFIKIATTLPDKTKLCMSDNYGEQEVYVLEFENDPPRLFLL